MSIKEKHRFNDKDILGWFFCWDIYGQNHAKQDIFRGFWR